MNPRAKYRLSRALAYASVLATAAISVSAWARGGGGHAFSGGHSGGGGGGSSGGGGSAYLIADILFRLLWALAELTVTHPLIGLPVDCLVAFFAWKLFQIMNHPGYDITNEHGLQSADSARIIRNGRVALARTRLDQLKAQLDPNFSQIALMDFLHALYSTIHHARGTPGRLRAYAGYLSPAALEALQGIKSGVTEISGVVVGAATVIDAGPIGPELPCLFSVEFEACYSETAGGATQNWYSRETWSLSRKAGVLSREPARIRQIACPACGAPANADAGGRCPACGNVVRSGEFDWFVERIVSVREPRPPVLVSDAGAGTRLPTLLDPHFSDEKKRLEELNPDFKWDKFNERAAFIFMQVQKAWTERKMELVRAYESEAVFETHSYWIQEYKRQHLVNVLKDIQLEQMVPARIQQDRFYSAITLRMIASMVDYTQSESGNLAGGDSARAHPFAEYWTFVRGKSAQPPKAGAGPKDCPACGAPLKINMAGVCEYCQAKVASGDFDWVLSSIEQDEAYTG